MGAFNRPALKQEVRGILKGTFFKVFLVLLVVGFLTHGPQVAQLLIGELRSESSDALALGGTIGSAFSALLPVRNGVDFTWPWGVVFGVYALIVAPLTIAIHGYAVRLYRGEGGDLASVFRDALHHRKPYWLANLWATLWYAVWQLPGSALLVLSTTLESQNTPLSWLALLAALAFSIAIIPITLRYSMVNYIVSDDPTLGARDALDRSKDMMRGHRWELFETQLSFLGWLLLVLLSFGLASVYVYPYIHLTMGGYYEYLRGARDHPLAGSDT